MEGSILNSDGVIDLEVLQDMYNTASDLYLRPRLFKEALEPLNTILEMLGAFFVKSDRIEYYFNNHPNYVSSLLVIYSIIASDYALCLKFTGNHREALNVSFAAAMVNPKPDESFLELAEKLIQASACNSGLQLNTTLREMLKDNPPGLQKGIAALYKNIQQGYLPSKNNYSIT